jgi:transglutaminase-like putative cysteine protease
MRFEVSAHIEYVVRFPSTLILSIHAQDNASQRISAETFTLAPRLRFESFVARGPENRYVRLETGRTRTLTIDYRATVHCEAVMQPMRGAEHTPVGELSSEALPFLFPSRYCQSDQLGKLAWDLFGAIDRPYEKVLAITDWIHENVEYVRGSTNASTSAFDTVTQRAGVCRDFAHLGIALCRALNIPARYFSGYAYQLRPPDFHACFECLIDGQWLLFDPTRLSHPNGLVRIATGRDAADTAVASIFGAVSCRSMEVDCRLGRGQKFQPLGPAEIRRHGVALPVRAPGS